MSDSTKLIGVIGDEDTVTGFILAGIGHRTAEGTNFLVVKPSASASYLKRSIFYHFGLTPHRSLP